MADSELGLPMPSVSTASEPYWEGAQQGELRLLRCRSCSAWVHYPRALCPACGSTDLNAEAVSGRGLIYSYSIVADADAVSFPSYGPRAPYIVVLVELAEGPRMIANLVEAGDRGPAIGDPVEVTFEDRDGFALPQFRPARPAPG